MAVAMNREALVRAYVAAFNAGDWERMTELFTPDATIRGVLGWGGLDVALPVWKELHEGMAMRLAIDDLILSGDRASALLTETGKFVGPFRGLAGEQPTGRAYEIVAIEWFEFAGDRIMRRWGARDSGAIRSQVLG
jgi:predicted ester cyclase